MSWQNTVSKRDFFLFFCFNINRASRLTECRKNTPPVWSCFWYLLVRRWKNMCQNLYLKAKSKLFSSIAVFSSFTSTIVIIFRKTFFLYISCSLRLSVLQLYPLNLIVALFVHRIALCVTSRSRNVDLVELFIFLPPYDACFCLFF